MRHNATLESKRRQQMNIYEKLSVIQTKLKAPKGQYNKFGNYNYRSCEDILEAVKPLLAEVKAAVVVTDDLELIGSRYYVKATARFYDTENEQSTVLYNTAYAREDESKKGMDGAQITGATSSYARKYALNGLFAIDDTKDSDTDETPEQPTLDEKLLAEAKRLNIDINNVATYLKKPVENLTNEDLQRCIDQKAKALGGAK
jgi:hypothetical protein